MAGSFNIALLGIGASMAIAATAMLKNADRHWRLPLRRLGLSKAEQNRIRRLARAARKRIKGLKSNAEQEEIMVEHLLTALSEMPTEAGSLDSEDNKA